MREFYAEVADRKRLAWQARYKKNGSKSKQCYLPTDRMTQKQWKERNGSVMTYQLNKPMDWKYFKQLPDDLKNDYICSLVSQYGVTISTLAKMMFVNQNTLGKYLKELGLSHLFGVGKSMTKQQRGAWAEFVGEPAVPDVIEDSPVEAEEIVQSDPVQIPVSSEPTTVSCVVPQRKSCGMRSFSLGFEGKLDSAMIANSISMLLGENAEGELEIHCKIYQLT